MCSSMNTFKTSSVFSSLLLSQFKGLFFSLDVVQEARRTRVTLSQLTLEKDATFCLQDVPSLPTCRGSCRKTCRTRLRRDWAPSNPANGREIGCIFPHMHTLKRIYIIQICITLRYFPHFLTGGKLWKW